MARQLVIVIKLGTSSIVDEATREPRLSTLTAMVETAVQLRRAGHRVVLVSSGAIGLALGRMGQTARPTGLAQVQALAAIGQCGLMRLWDELFAHLRQPVGQVLLTRGDIADRTRYRNAQSTVRALLDMAVVPVINENDSVAVAEIKFGDNDTLSAIAAGMVRAHYLFLMTDVDCLYDKNPRLHADARPIPEVADLAARDTAAFVDVSSAGSALGTGGMSTKLVAARLATSAGVTTVIARASRPANILRILAHLEAKAAASAPAGAVPSTTLVDQPGALPAADRIGIATEQAADLPLHTVFVAATNPIHERYFWILHGLAPHGTIFIDEGASRALHSKAGLLPAGVVDVEGTFAQQEAVRLCVATRRPDGSTDRQHEIGRAIVNYAAAEVARIKGRQSSDVRKILGYADSEYVALRENIALLNADHSRPETPLNEGVALNV